MSNDTETEAFLEQTCEAIRASTRVSVRGAGTKSSSYPDSPESCVIEMKQFQGMLEYDPGEFTFTARAGTTLIEIRDVLAEQGQYMPFDPPLVEAGATIGGTVATGINGSGRVLYGGLRDFILGVEFIDGLGNLHRGGGKVVKNAAGFDLPKFLVGSLGRFGVLTEFCFKVFPEPASYRTLLSKFDSLAEAVDAMTRLNLSGLQFTALDIETFVDETKDSRSREMALRICGDDRSMDQHAIHIAKSANCNFQTLVDEDDQKYWSERRELEFPQRIQSDNKVIIKVPLTPAKMLNLESALPHSTAIRFMAAGNVALLFSSGKELEEIDSILKQQSLSGLVICGKAKRYLIGMPIGNLFSDRIKSALDPENRFGTLTN